jgi:hypothetical protein
MIPNASEAGAHLVRRDAETPRDGVRRERMKGDLEETTWVS